MMGGFGGGKGGGGGQGGSGNCVFVQGFDFGTTSDQVWSHMSGAGNVQNVQMVGKGEAEVTYGSAEEAAMAAQMLQKTTIEGNSRYIDVKVGGANAVKGAFGGGGKGAFGGGG